MNLDKQKQQALNFAKKLQQKHIASLKNLNQNIQNKKQSQKNQQLDKKYQQQRKQRLQKIKNIPNQQIQKSIQIAKKQNQKFKGQFNQQTSFDQLFDTLSDDLKNY